MLYIVTMLRSIFSIVWVLSGHDLYLKKQGTGVFDIVTIFFNVFGVISISYICWWRNLLQLTEKSILYGYKKRFFKKYLIDISYGKHIFIKYISYYICFQYSILTILFHCIFFCFIRAQNSRESIKKIGGCTITDTLRVHIPKISSIVSRYALNSPGCLSAI